VIILTSNKLILLAVVIVILIISASLLYILNERSPTSKHIIVNTTSSSFQNISNTQFVNNANTTAAENYSLAVENFEKILGQAREIYLNAIRNNETLPISIDNFSKMLILNSTIVNETTLYMNNTDYTYVILQVYNANNNFTFCPQRIEINNISVELIPKNPSVTYTGGTAFNYMINYDNNSYNATFYFIGFMFSSFNLTASTQNIAQIYLTATTQNAANDLITPTATIPTGVINIYAVTVAVNNELGSPEHISYAYLILIENA